MSKLEWHFVALIRNKDGSWHCPTCNGKGHVWLCEYCDQPRAQSVDSHCEQCGIGICDSHFYPLICDDGLVDVKGLCEQCAGEYLFNEETKKIKEFSLYELAQIIKKGKEDGIYDRCIVKEVEDYINKTMQIG